MYDTKRTMINMDLDLGLYDIVSKSKQQTSIAYISHAMIWMAMNELTNVITR